MQSSNLSEKSSNLSEKSSNLSEILGGIDSTDPTNTTNVISIVGGYNKYLNPYESKMVVGDTIKSFVKNIIIDWDSFKNTYYVNKLLENKYYNKLLETMNNLFPLPFSTNNDTDMLYMIYTIYTSPSHKICNSIEKHVNLLDPFKKTMKYLFMIWKLYIEKLIELFVNLREKFISMNDLSKNISTPNKLEYVRNDFNKLVNKWSDIDEENNIDTSSVILFFNFPPKSINLEKTIPKIHWNIKNPKDEVKETSPLINSTVVAALDKKINKFLNAIKKSEFEYLGFCPHIVIKRFKVLLLFPTGDLLDIISDLNQILKNKSNPSDLCQQIYKQSIPVIKKFNEVSNDICKLKPICNIKLKKEKLCSVDKFPNKTYLKIKCYEKYINAYINLYKQLLPHLTKKENLICKISVIINVISNDIQKIITLIDKMIIY
jgi:hypothetical protein